MVQDDAVYRCIGLQCGRLMPRRVNYCPWCGTAQHVVQPAGAVPPAPPKPPVEPRPAAPVAPAPAPAPAPPAAASVAAGAAVAGVAAAAVPPLPTPASTSTSAPTAPVPPPSGKAAAGMASATPAAQAGAQPGRGIPPPPGVGSGGALPARPPQRKPIRLRWWIAALAALWLIWMFLRPSGTLIERRMDRAVALAVECKARQAQDELIDLRKTRATPEQLRQVQSSLNKAAADCTRAEQRAKAWSDTRGAVQKLRRARSYDKALARLATFTKRWGEDDDTRALKQEIGDEREHPLADPTRGE